MSRGGVKNKMINETQTQDGREGRMSRLVANLVGTSYEAFKKKIERTHERDSARFTGLEESRTEAYKRYVIKGRSALFGQEVITLNEEMITFNDYLITRHTQVLQRSALEGDYDSYLSALKKINMAKGNIPINEKVIREVKEDQLKYGGRK